MSIEAMIASLRALGDDSIAEEIAKEAVSGVVAAVKKTATAGTSPEGKAWPTKRDGSRALPNAAEGVTGRTMGSILVIELAEPYAFHNNRKGKTRRPVLPDGGGALPDDVQEALDRAAQRVFQRKVGQ